MVCLSTWAIARGNSYQNDIHMLLIFIITGNTKYERWTCDFFGELFAPHLNIRYLYLRWLYVIHSWGNSYSNGKCIPKRRCLEFVLILLLMEYLAYFHSVEFLFVIRGLTIFENSNGGKLPCRNTSRFWNKGSSADIVSIQKWNDLRYENLFF